MNKLEPRKMDEKAKVSLKSRAIVAAVLIAILVPTIVFGSYLMLAVITVFLLIAVHEVVRAPGKKFHPWVYILAFLFTLLVYGWFLIKSNVQEAILLPPGQAFEFSLERYFSTLNISLFAVCAMVGLFFLGAILDKDFSLGDLTYMVVMILMLGIGFQAVLFIRYYPFYLFTFDEAFSGQTLILATVGKDLGSNPGFAYGVSSELFFFVAAGVVLNDTFAYFVGSAFGRHPLNKRVSPRKSVEGLVGGWVVSFVLMAAFGLALAGTGYPMLPTLDIEHWYWILLLAFMIPAFSDLGDLSFSLIKRYFNVKDYGVIFRAHGGVLDRADSVIFAFIGTAIFLVLISGNWNVFLMA